MEQAHREAFNKYLLSKWIIVSLRKEKEQVSKIKADFNILEKIIAPVSMSKMFFSWKNKIRQANYKEMAESTTTQTKI